MSGEENRKGTARLGCQVIDEQYELRPFVSAHAGEVAGWVASPEELFLLAPLTKHPLTAEKVRGWTGGTDRPYVYFSGAEPVAYGELNQVPQRAGQLWVGHFVVAPSARGRSTGRRFLRALLDEAFLHCEADSVALVVFPENGAAIRCYRSAGFADLGPQRRRFPGHWQAHELRHMKLTRQDYLRRPGRTGRTGRPEIQAVCHCF